MSEDNTLKIRNWVAGLIVTIVMAALANGAILITSLERLKSNQGHQQEVISEMKAEVKEVKEEIRALVVSGTQKRYTSDDATADKKIMLDLIQSVNKRVDVLERLLMVERGQASVR